MRAFKNSLVLPLCAALALALSACGGADPAPELGVPLSQPLPAPTPDLCFKGRNDTATAIYVSIDGVCSKMFAPMASPAAAGNPPVSAMADEPQPPTAQTRFTWATFLSWATTAYPQFFRGSVQDGVLGEYTYRYWPATGHYLGMRNSEQLYVLGPATDNDILYIGTLGALLCSVYPDNCPTAAAGTGGTSGGTTSGTTGGTSGTGSGGAASGGADIPGDTSTGMAIVSTAPYASTIEQAGDEDWFAVDLAAGTAYTFNLEGSPTGKGTLSDPYLKLYNSAGRLVAYNDDVAYPSNLNARLQYTPTTGGRHYVSASGFSAIGTYQLTAAVGGTSGSTGTGSTGTGSTGTGSTGTGSTGTGSTGTGGSTGTTVRLTTSKTGLGEGTVTPASASYTRGTRVTASVEPGFFSEFMGWTSNSAACVGYTLACELALDSDTRMEARIEPVLFESSFDTSFPTTSGNCNWQVNWTNTRLELRYSLSGGQYVGRLRVVGTRRAVVTRTLTSNTTCNGSSNNVDLTYTIGTWGGVGSGANARVRTFDGEGDEYLTLATGGLPGPSVGGGNGIAGFLPIQINLQYTGTNRSGSTQVITTLTRLVR